MLLEQVRDQGFVVLRGAVDSGPITAEVDRALAEAAQGERGVTTLPQGSGTVTFSYVPMMCERTPVSLGLLDQFAAVAAEMLGRAVVPGRAKGTRYYGDTGWHRDSKHQIPSLGFLMYLDPVDAGNGALSVVPGSHVDLGMPLPDPTRPAGQPVETLPGDVIVFDEHLIHGSTGGGERRQWRVDYVIDPRGPEEHLRVQEWFGQSVPDERTETTYDATAYPSYGQHRQSLDRPWTARLAELGLY